MAEVPDAARWARLQTLLAEALDLGAEARATFVARSAEGDADLAAELADLLDAADAVPAFLDETPAWSLGEDAADEGSLGRQIGPYRLVGELGRGGQGRVFLAVRDDVGSRVALKVLRGGLAAPDLIGRFLTERRVLAGLDHPNIARLLDAGTTEADSAGERAPYYVMEVVEGTPITAYAAHRQLDIRQRLGLFLQVCEAVRFAHGRLVVHRDLKPSNILVTEDGQVKLLDFGIAKLLDDEDRDVTQTGHRLLTPDYAAPEQVLGTDVTVAVDVYALGVLLYEMLSGTRPIDTSGGLGRAVRAVSEEVPERPSARVDGERQRHVRGDLDAIALKSLEKAPADRYVSVEAFAVDVRRHLDGLPVQARRPTLRYRASRFVRRHALGVGVGALAVALAATFVWRETTLRAEAEAARDEAQATADFVLGMFDAFTDARASEERVDTLRTLGLLDRAAARLEADPTPTAQTRGLLHLRLGQIFVGLGYEERGRRQFAAGAEFGGLRSALRADIFYHLGASTHANGDCAGAVRAYDEAVAVLEQSGVSQEALMTARSSRSSARACLGDFDGAITDAQKAQAYFGVLPGDDGAGLHILADVLNRAGRVDDAIAAMSESIAIADRQNPEGHPVPVARRLYLVWILVHNGRAAEAIPTARRAYRSALARNGPSHHRTLDAQDRLIGLYLDTGQVGVAEPLVESMEQSVGTLPAVDTQPRFHAALRRSQVDARLGRLASAEDIVREALRGVDAVPILYRESLRIDALHHLAYVVSQQGRMSEAAEIDRRAEAAERARESRQAGG